MSNEAPDLVAARRRVQRFGIAIVSLAAAVAGVKGVDALMARTERAHQAECLENLRAICFAERMVQAKGEPFLDRVDKLPTPVAPGNRFAYFLGPGPMAVRGSDAGAVDPAATAIGVDLTGWQVPKGMKQEVQLTDLPATFLSDAGLGASGTCPGPGCQFITACAGNLDVDNDLDVWSASTQPRTTQKGSRVEPCEPFHERADLDP